MLKNRYPLMDGENGDGANAGGGAAGSDGAAAAAAAAAGAAKPWYEGADADTVGYLQSRGLDRKTPTEAAMEAIKAHRAAEKFVGTPTDQLIRMPKNAADEEGWKNLWAKVGKPSKPEEYDFSNVKFGDGSELDEGFVNFMRDKAYAHNLTKDAAAALTADLAKFMEGAETNERAAMTAKLAEEKDALSKNWGANMAANTFVAQQGAKLLGLGPEEIAAMEGVVGYAKVMEAMRRVGVLNKEDGFVAGQGSTSGGVMTREQAVARMTELKADQAFATKLIKGDAEAGRQWTALQRIVAGV